MFGSVALLRNTLPTSVSPATDSFHLSLDLVHKLTPRVCILLCLDLTLHITSVFYLSKQP